MKEFFAVCKFCRARLWYNRVMKRIIILAVAMQTCSLAASPFEHCVFESIPLDGAWEMAYASNGWESAECHAFAGKEVRSAVPGYWEDMADDFRAAGLSGGFAVNPLYVRQEFPISGRAFDTTLPNVYGTFFYRRRVSLGRVRPAVLAFECVRNQVRVWVNGRFVAFRQGFSAPFELEIPEEVLREGENEIVMAVSNCPNTGYEGAMVSGLSTRGLFASTGGVAGRLELRFPANGVSDVYVTTARDLKSFTVHVSGGERFSYAISAADGSVVARGEANGDFTLPADGMEFWTPESPALYTLSIAAPGGECRRRFGIRRLEAVGEGLRLNGRPVYLRGVTEHCYFAKTVHLPRDLDFYRSITARRKELGFNFVRFHTYVPPEEYLEAMDELGMLVHVESPNFVTVDEYKSIIAFARRHPCVVIYCTGNETRIDRKAEAYLREVADAVHAGTDSLFSPMSAMRGVEYALVKGKDDIVGKPFSHNPRRMERLAAFCDLFTSYQLGAVSYNSLNGPGADKIDEWGDAFCGKPRLSHEICIDGSYADLSLEGEYPPGSPVVATGLFSGLRRQLERRGLLGRAPAYFRNSCEWMRRIRKFTFEKMRASRRTTGFDFLGDINTHWHTFGYSVGMMDEFFRLKPGETVQNVLRYNSAAVLLSDLGSDFNVRAGEKRRVSFSVSNYAGEAHDAELRVALVADGRGGPVFSEARRIGRVPCGKVSELGGFDVEFPADAVPRKYLLKAALAGGAVAAENEWEMYAFPPSCGGRVAARPAGEAVRVVDNISDEDLVAAMERGERVLLLGAGPFKSLPTTYRIGLAGRCSGCYATVVKAGHPALAGMPHEGFCGWQFRWLMEGGRAVQLEAGVPFDPIIDVASSDKFPIRQSSLFEYRVGPGRMLVCSFKFRDGDPAAAWLRGRLEGYAASDKFNPDVSLSPDQLRAVINAPLLTGEENSNKARNPNDPSSLVRAGALAEP